MGLLRSVARLNTTKLTTALLLASAIPAVTAAADWDQIGPEGGTVRALATLPGQPDEHLAALLGFGVYRSADGGNTWTPSSTGLSYTDMARLAVAPTDPRIVYATTMRGDFFVSTDRGHTWSDPTTAWPLRSRIVVEIAVDPDDPSIVYAGGRSDTTTDYRLMRSEDRGRTWTDFEGPFVSRISAVVIDPNDPQIIFVAMEWTVGHPGGLLRTTDGGATWQTVIEEQAVGSVAVDPSDTRLVLAGAHYGVAVSNDQGETFELNNDSPFQVRTLVFDPQRPETVWTGSPLGVARSDDQGASWAPVEGGEPVWPASAVAVANGDILVGGVNGLIYRTGLFRSRNGDGPWQPSNRGFQIGHPTFGAVELATDPPVLLFPSTNLYRSTDGGRTLEVVDLDYFGTVLAAAPSSPSTVYMAGGFLWRSDDAGVSWRDLGAPGDVFGLAVDPQNEDVVYVLTVNELRNNVLFKTTDGGASWDQVLTHRYMHWQTVDVDPHEPETVLVGGAHGMVKSINGGATWPSVEYFEGGHGEDFFSVAFDPHTPGGIVAGGELGSWYSTDGGASWSDDVYPYIIPFRTAAHVFDAQVPRTVYGLDAFDLVPFQSNERLGTYTPLTEGLPMVAVDCVGSCPIQEPVPIWNLGASADGNSLYASSKFGLFRKRLAALDRVLPNIGETAGGTEVTLIGEGFGPYTYVTFGDQPATKTVVMSDSILVATTPPHSADTVDLTVWTAQGRVVTAKSAFTFSDNGTVGISLDPGMQVVRTGEIASLTVALPEPQPTDVEISLESSSGSSLDLPDNVTIQAGQRSATVTVRAIAYEANGTWITATLPASLGGSSASAQVIVVDEIHEPPAKLAVPGVASSAGANGSFFRTSLWITNPGPLDTALRLRYVPAVGRGPGGGQETADLEVPALQSVVFDDVLREAFGADQTYGTVIVHVHDGLPTPLVSARSYNDADAEGTYGQYIEAVPIPEINGPPSYSVQNLVGLGGNSKVRTNVGVQNLETRELQVTLQVYGADGVDLGSPIEITLPSLSMLQVNKINIEAGAGSQRLFGVRVRAVGRIFAYASRVDQKTSDPVFIPGDLGWRQGNPLWLDGIAVTEGAAGTFFRSSLVVANISEFPVEVTARFAKWRRSMDTAGEPVPLASLGPWEMVQFDDVLTEVFGLSDVAGTLELQSDRVMIAWARTYNDAGDRGTYGQLISPIRRQDLLGDGGAILHGLSQDDTFRTNMGIWSTSTTSLEATLYSSDGQPVASGTYDLEANTQLFVSKVAQSIGGPWISGGFLRLVPEDPYSVYVWTSVIDNRSSDQTFIRSMRVGQ